jgi:hypothetical protein
LPDHVVVRIVPQHKEIFFQRIGSFPLLQEFLGAFYTLPYLGAIQSSCNLRHAKGGRGNPASILGAAFSPSNAVKRRPITKVTQQFFVQNSKL